MSLSIVRARIAVEAVAAVLIGEADMAAEAVDMIAAGTTTEDNKSTSS